RWHRGCAPGPCRRCRRSAQGGGGSVPRGRDLARHPRIGGAALTSTFASWLARRAKGQIEFAPGIATPRSFGDPRREHLATRRAGGLFDFSFMQCAEIEGLRALECVEALQTRRLAALRPGRIA